MWGPFLRPWKAGTQNQKSFRWSHQPRVHGPYGTFGHRADGKARAEVECYMPVNQPLDLGRDKLLQDAVAV